MNTLFVSSAALAASLSLIGSVAAQQAGTATQPAAAAVERRPVTLRGCLQSWDGTPTGVGVDTPSGMTPLTYVLTDVESSTRETRPVGTSGAAGGAVAGTSDAPKTGTEVAHGTYVVQAADSKVALADHVNREVEVTGVLEMTRPHEAGSNAAANQQGAGAGGSGATGVPPSSATTAPQPVKVQKVNVQTVKVTAQSCARR